MDVVFTSLRETGTIGIPLSTILSRFIDQGFLNMEFQNAPVSSSSLPGLVCVIWMVQMEGSCYPMAVAPPVLWNSL